MSTTRPDRLHLYEELVLLGLHNDKGITLSSWIPHAIAAAVLLELEFLGRINIEDSTSKYVDVIDDTPVDELVMHAVLHRIATHEGSQHLSYWTWTLDTSKDLLELAAEQLVADDVLQMETSRAFLVLKRTTYPQINPEPEQEILSRLEHAIATDEPVDERTALLVGLAHAASLLRMEFGFDVVAQRRDRIESLVERSNVAQHTVDALTALSGGKIRFF